MGGDAQSRVGLEKSVAVVLSGTIFPTSANAGVAQLVEHFLAKEDVARSNRVTRSNLLSETLLKLLFYRLAPTW